MGLFREAPSVSGSAAATSPKRGGNGPPLHVILCCPLLGERTAEGEDGGFWFLPLLGVGLRDRPDGHGVFPLLGVMMSVGGFPLFHFPPWGRSLL